MPAYTIVSLAWKSRRNVCPYLMTGSSLSGCRLTVIISWYGGPLSPKQSSRSEDSCLHYRTMIYFFFCCCYGLEGNVSSPPSSAWHLPAPLPEMWLKCKQIWWHLKKVCMYQEGSCKLKCKLNHFTSQIYTRKHFLQTVSAVYSLLRGSAKKAKARTSTQMG